MIQKRKYSSIIILSISRIYTKIIFSLILKAFFYLIVLLSIQIYSFASTDVNQLQKIVAADRGANDQFSWHVSISGDYAIVSSPDDDEDANGGNTLASAGSAYIYVRSGNTWTQQQKLVASDRGAGDQFGVSVSISGDYAIVGSWKDDEDASGGNTLLDAGSAYIFVRNGTTWTQQQKIVASDRGTGDQFGVSVAISGDYAIVGANRDDEDASGGNTLADAGSVYIFVRSGVTWTQQQKIVALDRGLDDRFGSSLFISNEFAIIGAGLDDEDENGGNTLTDAGSVYSFVRSGSTWTQQQKIVASDRGAGDQFGIRIAIDGDYAIIGANLEDEDASGGNTLTNAGSAYIFVKNGNTWTQQQKLVASDRATNDWFGFTVSLSGEYAVVGAYPEDEDENGANTLVNAGSAYIYKRNGTNWSFLKKIVASDRASTDHFGYSVAISGNYVLVGARAEDEDASGGNTLANAGSAYIYKITVGPSFTTNNVTSISSFTAISGGEITNSGTNPILARGIVWDINPNPTIVLSTKTSDGSGTGSFSSQITNLQQITTYYVRAYATTLYGTYYGNEISFRTPYPIILDGNQDGILDSTQDHVHTFYDPTGTKLITIVDLNNNVLSQMSSSISNEQSYTYPYGLINLKVAASQTQLKIYFHGTSSLTGYEYRKLFADNRIRKYDYAVFGSEIIGGNTVATVTLTLVDGGIGDSDGIVNGIITDPGGPAIAVVISNIPTLSEWARIFLISLLVVFGVWKIRKLNV